MRKAHHGNWKGGEIKDSNGYIRVLSPDHPFKLSYGRGYVRRARLVMEEYLRKHDPDHPALIEIDGVKYLRRDWVVHHENEIRDDDRVENLEVKQDFDHRSSHNKGSKNPNYMKEPWNKGIPHSKETKLKLSLVAQKQNQPRDDTTGRFISKGEL